MNIFRVIEPGLLTTVQDLGRFGYQQFGVPLSGVLDEFACRAANLLVGNPEGAAVLETTFLGPKLEVLDKAWAALTGAGMPILLDGERVDDWTSFELEPGQVLSFKPASNGLRGYLAVSGGFDVNPVMGSRSTYTGGGLGGFRGRALLKGDILARIDGPSAIGERTVPPPLRPKLGREISLRAVPGPQDDFFDMGLETFFNSVYKVGPKADRMGYRLEGPAVLLKEGAPKSIISEPCLPGGVQIPPDGQPIILLVEQTVGGYVKSAVVISPDLGKVAQARPGDTVRFERIDLTQAHALVREAEERMDRIRAELNRLRSPGSGT